MAARTDSTVVVCSDSELTAYQMANDGCLKWVRLGLGFFASMAKIDNPELTGMDIINAAKAEAAHGEILDMPFDEALPIVEDLRVAAEKLYAAANSQEFRNANPMNHPKWYAEYMQMTTLKSWIISAKHIQALLAKFDDMKAWLLANGDENLKVMAQIGYVPLNKYWSVASAAFDWGTSVAEAAKAEALKTKMNAFMGAVGDKMLGIPCKLVHRHSFQTDFGTTTLLKFETESGNTVTWFASNPPQFDESREVMLKGTVKGHNEYKGVNETILTRCKIEQLPVAV